MEGAKASAGYIVSVLLSRSMKGTKSSVEADYRTALDTLVADLLTVLGQPEWPSAELYLLIFSKAMVSAFKVQGHIIIHYMVEVINLAVC
jgi:hypothetical protein